MHHTLLGSYSQIDPFISPYTIITTLAILTYNTKSTNTSSHRGLRKRRQPLDPPSPLEGRSVPNQNSRTDRLQSLSPIRLFCRPSPKVAIFLFRTPNFRFYQIFGPLFPSPKSIKFRILLNRSKISKITSRKVFGTDFDLFGYPFQHIFLKMSCNPELCTLQHFHWHWQTLTFTSQAIYFGINF